tara:strand:- start:401 stop:1339 length:939 start_codon:yes stop_codon:yes gene_type:complete
MTKNSPHNLKYLSISRLYGLDLRDQEELPQEYKKLLDIFDSDGNQPTGSKLDSAIWEHIPKKPIDIIHNGAEQFYSCSKWISNDVFGSLQQHKTANKTPLYTESNIYHLINNLESYVASGLLTKTCSKRYKRDDATVRIDGIDLYLPPQQLILDVEALYRFWKLSFPQLLSVLNHDDMTIEMKYFTIYVLSAFSRIRVDSGLFIGPRLGNFLDQDTAYFLPSDLAILVGISAAGARRSIINFLKKKYSAPYVKRITTPPESLTVHFTTNCKEIDDYYAESNRPAKPKFSVSLKHARQWLEWKEFNFIGYEYD